MFFCKSFGMVVNGKETKESTELVFPNNFIQIMTKAPLQPESKYLPPCFYFQIVSLLCSNTIHFFKCYYYP